MQLERATYVKYETRAVVFIFSAAPLLRAQISFQSAAHSCNDPRPYGWLAVAYFVVVVLLGGMVMPTLMIGVITIAFMDAMDSHKNDRKDALLVERTIALANAWLPGDATFMSKEQLNMTRKVFTDIDFSSDGKLDEAEMMPFLEYVADEFLGGPGILDLTSLFHIVDADGDGVVSWPEVGPLPPGGTTPRPPPQPST